MAIARVIPIYLLALERKRIYERAPEAGRAEVAEQERNRTIELWQERWTADTEGRWTHRLIGRLTPWAKKEHGETNFYLTQFLTGHGYFRHYLHKMGKTTTPRCKYCGHERDDAEHTFFDCPRWDEERSRLEETGRLTPDNAIALMLTNVERWNAVALYVERVLRQKKGRQIPRRLTT